jgi:hypothetical protein
MNQQIDEFLREEILNDLWDEYQGILGNNPVNWDFMEYCHLKQNIEEIGTKILNYIGPNLEKIMGD